MPAARCVLRLLPLTPPAAAAVTTTQIAYMLSLFYQWVGYTYFLSTRGAVLDLQPFKTFWTGRALVR